MQLYIHLIHTFWELSVYQHQGSYAEEWNVSFSLKYIAWENEPKDKMIA